MAPVPSPSGEAGLLTALRAGDEQAFLGLVGKLHSGLIRVAMLYVRTHDVAEEVVQESWIAVLEGLHRFEGRSSLKTWISHIVANQARTRAVREARCLPFSSFDESVARELADTAPSVAPERFTRSGDGEGHGRAGHWADPPRDWRRGSAEGALLDAETLRFLEVALDTLPPAQKIVVTLRDVEGWESEEVCNALGLSETNQRVLLHRGRARLRAMLERHLGHHRSCTPTRSATRSARS
ncbi:MAG: sigma-70 family RNA polymerase sigma factor [Deltaproteobacteria bacterium]|nr:sigma-70 family RNA polymerase sigma factor [Deltaproteobacteria bacterium]